MRRLLATVLLLAAAAPLSAQTLPLAEAVARGDAGLDLRYRYEFVDQDGFDKEANASTLRIRLNYATAAWRGWSAYIEFDHLLEVLLNDFNNAADSSPRRARYPTVADVSGSDLNQLFLEFRAGEAGRWRLGRQRILLDNQRHVGGVGWRQNEQTFDALSYRFAPAGGPEFFYSYIANANRIFGNEVPAGDHEQDTHLLNAKFPLGEHWQLSGYGYLIDNADAPAFSTRTLGARLSGSLPAGEGRLKLTVELAQQSDAANGPVSYDAGYGRVDAVWEFSAAWSAGLAIERLGGDAAKAGGAFRTPLATLHAFNGWADQFLTTPDAGIDDRMLSLGYAKAVWKLDAVFHDLVAESGGGDYGTELDLSASRKLGERYGLLLKLATFDAEAGSGLRDTNKFWLMATAAF